MNLADACAPPGPARFSSAEFWRLGESGGFDDIKLELIGGELHRLPLPGNEHGRWQVAIIAALAGVVPIERLLATIGIELSANTVVGADCVLLAAAVAGDGWLRPTDLALAVEVAVPTRDRDLGLKRRLYAAAGVPTYWVVDAERGVVHVFDRPEGGDYLGLALVRFGEPLAVPGTDGAITIG